MAAETPETPGQGMQYTWPGQPPTPADVENWSDRALIVHLMQHAEHQTEVIDRLEAELIRFRPLLDMLLPNGQPPDAISMAQVARNFRKNRRGHD